RGRHGIRFQRRLVRNLWPLLAYNQYMTRALLLALLPLCVHAADLAGNWNFHLIRFGEEFGAARVELKTDVAKITGTLNELKLEGEVKGDQIHIKLVRPNSSEWGTLDGKIQGEEMGGTVQQGKDSLEWHARR